jgi:hypothetical protein
MPLAEQSLAALTLKQQLQLKAVCCEPDAEVLV